MSAERSGGLRRADGARRQHGDPAAGVTGVMGRGEGGPGDASGRIQRGGARA